jgi:multidrug transporter EmrE-like cation transporter
MAQFKNPIVFVVFTQILFSLGDLLARANMKKYGFTLSAFISWWFLAYFCIRQIAMFGQLYVFSSLALGKTMALFGAVSIVLSSILGLLLLNEVLSVKTYIGVALSVSAFMVLAVSR